MILIFCAQGCPDWLVFAQILLIRNSCTFLALGVAVSMLILVITCHYDTKTRVRSGSVRILLTRLFGYLPDKFRQTAAL